MSWLKYIVSRVRLELRPPRLFDENQTCDKVSPDWWRIRCMREWDHDGPHDWKPLR